jgi:hypothetical protein
MEKACAAIEGSDASNDEFESSSPGERPILSLMCPMSLRRIVRRSTLVAALGCGLFAGCRQPDSHTDFSGTWEMAKLEYTVLPDENAPRYTPRAQARLDFYARHFDAVKDSPANLCFVKGMPWTMLFRARTYPMEIYQTRDRLFMSFEPYDGKRIIHLDRSDFPENVPPSADGYSVGRWQGDTLVIETRNMTARHPVSPTQRSDKARVIERWRLQPHREFGQILDVDVTVHDPETFVEPARGRGAFKRAPPGVVVGGYNCADSLWDDFVARRLAGIEPPP